LDNLLIQYPKYHIPHAINDMLRYGCVWIFLLQTRYITGYLFGIGCLNLKPVQRCFQFFEFGIGIVLELDDHPDSGKTLVVFAHKFQIGSAPGVGSLYIPGKPLGRMAAAQFRKYISMVELYRGLHPD